MPSRTRLAPAWLLVAGVASALAGCSKSEPASPPAPQVQLGDAAITGVVRLIGSPPPEKYTTVACDPTPGAPTLSHRDRTVEVGKDNGLAGVYVYVTASSAHPSLKGSGTAEPPALLDQVQCDFVPHALGLQVGQSLKLRNSDPTFHNVHWDPQLNRPINVGFAPVGRSGEKILAFTAPEFISVRCDVHPWMTSSIGVFEHPFFAVTDADGRFTLSRLPPGTYTLATHHPFYGPGPTTQVTLPAPGSTATTDLSFAPASPGSSAPKPQ